MTLRLSIENVDRLPDGGPIRIEVKGRGLDLGRDSHLDWTLPDPSRSISGKHCEIRYRDGGYWLHDVSTNGTFVNGAEYRLDAPHLLRDGDRLSIGPYIIAVSVEEGRKPRSPASAAEASLDAGLADVWAPDGRGRSAGNRRQAPDGADARRSARLSRFCFVPRAAETCSRRACGTGRDPEDDWLTAINLSSAISAGAERSGASHTDADAAGGRRPSRPDGPRPESRRPTAPRHAKSSIASLGRLAFLSAFLFSQSGRTRGRNRRPSSDDGGESGADAGVASGVDIR